ncbi:prolyl oligopeptidase family serine peptidase [Nocardiopsis composta]
MGDNRHMSFPRQQARTRRFTLGAPKAFGISPDGRRIAFLRSRHGTDGAACLWLLDLDTGRERLIADPRAIGAGEEEDLPPEERARRERLRESGGGIVAYSVDDAFTRAAFTLSGRLYYADLAGDDPGPFPLPATGAVVDPRICPRGENVAYVSGGALRSVSIGSGADRVLAEPDADGVTWGLADFIAAEEMGRYRGMWWSPDGGSLLAARVDESAVARWHIADPASPEAVPQTIAYPAAGTGNADVRLAVLPLDGSGPQWLEWDRRAYPYLVRAGWTTGPEGTPTALFTVQNRAQSELTVFSADPATGLTGPVRSERDEVWVEIMPGVPGFTSGGEQVWIGRTAGGERRLVIGGRPVGPGDLYVRGVCDIDGDRVLFTASRPARPGRVELWLADAEEGTAGPVEPPGGGDGGVDSGRMRGGTLVVQRRALDADGVRTLVVTGAHTGTRAKATEIASLAEAPELPAPAPRLWRAGERSVPSALLLPSWFDPEGEHAGRRLPVLMDPYGGPHAQRVLEARGAYLTSQWFAEQGFAVLIADGRGTPGIGVDWEQAVRGDLAGPVLEDQVAALHDAADRHGFLDLDRVGVRGWSFGGYLAALAVLRRPDVFHAAVAGAPVIDWRLYDTHYTERYLGLPEEEPEAYRTSSLLDDAAGLERPLMLVHGLADDNVVFAHTQRLSSALLAAGRPHTVLPLAGITHAPNEEATAENLLLLQVDFLKSSLGGF